MTLLYFDPRFREHETGHHPENPGRVDAIGQALEKSGLADACTRPSWQSVTDEQIARAHASAYVERLDRMTQAGGGQIEQDTVMSAASFDVARLGSGAACDAVDRVITGPEKRAFCAIRPPGHHALNNAAMGFCLLNHVAIAALHAIAAHQLQRVLIIDWDVHHGNGTQAIFWDDPRVGFFSIHRWPFYPGTGGEKETGAADGLGTTVNVPIEMGTSTASFHRQFQRGIERLAEQIQPELVLISAGFDAHHRDPIGSLGLNSEDFIPLTQRVMQLADQYCGGRVVSLLEGGYHPAALGESATLHLQTLNDS